MKHSTLTVAGGFERYGRPTRRGTAPAGPADAGRGEPLSGAAWPHDRYRHDLDSSWDATILGAPSSTKNKSGDRNPEMRSTSKNGQWHFGMKAHVDVDAGTKLWAESH